MKQVKADNLQDRNLWRSGLAPLPVCKRKVKRKANATVPLADKRRKIGKSSATVDPKDTSPEPTERRVRIVSKSNGDESLRNVVCLSSSDNDSDPESGFSLAPSVPKLDSIVTVWNQIVPQELKDSESNETIMNEIMELVNERSGSGVISGSENKKVSAPRVGMSLEKVCRS